jgi:uncharacterized protein (DUF1810 family)
LSLERYIKAQAPIYARALAELKRGEKQSHWMWYIFPQLAGLGRSSMSQTYAIQSLEEAREYLAHPVLGARMRECCQVLLALEGKTAHEIFRQPDDLKFRSSLTLFALAAPDESLFDDLLLKYFAGKEDPATLELLEGPH